MYQFSTQALECLLLLKCIIKAEITLRGLLNQLVLGAVNKVYFKGFTAHQSRLLPLEAKDPSV